MTSKERAKLRSIASTMETIYQIGKNPIGETLIQQTDEALTAREMIKLKVLDTCEMSAAEVANALAEATQSEVIQVIGSKLILFRKRPKSQKKPSYLDEPKTK